MRDLRILFTAADPGYLVHLTDDEGNRLGVEVPFTPFLDERDYDDLRWYLEEYMDLPDGGAVVRARRIEGNLDQWGRKLHDALFTALENRALLKELLAGPEPRELTLATQDSDLLRLPWELMADEAGSLAQRVSVRRQLETPEKATPRPAQLPLRMLYIVSRPSDAGFIDPRLTAKAFLDALDPLGGSVRVDFCRPPTLARMEEMLRDAQRSSEPYGLVHFDGHGTFRPESQVSGLFFESPDDCSEESATDFVSANRLGNVLTRYSIPLVILEACRSATLGKTAVFRSVAPRLIQAGVGSVLAMSHAVHVEATRLLLDRFYRELVQGATIGHAVAEARKALIETPARWIETGPDGRTIDLQDWFLPHLYQREADEALVPSDAVVSLSQHIHSTEAGKRFRGPATRDESGSFPPPPQYGFRGRARELHELERRFRSGRGIVLHAMGGMGKTALATEAARWLTRSGLFRDGACFLSFEQFANADRAVQVLGTYLAGPKFEQLPATEQRRRAIELFQQKEVLIVWDNFESALPQFNDGADSPYSDEDRRHLAELFRDLTVGPGMGCLLVTCRPGETGLSAQRYELQGLARADSLWLISSILRRDGLSLNDPRLSRDKLDPLLRDLADYPLSLELVGPHLRVLTPEEIRADFSELLVKFEQEAPEERNQSLLASLEFSLRHLSLSAREALPWLGLFSVGVFEYLLLSVSQLAPEAWKPIRYELEAIALLRREDEIQIGDHPFLRFHPTLTSAATTPGMAQSSEVRGRFIDVYLALWQRLGEILKSPHAWSALEIMKREEANYRTAVNWALSNQQFNVAAALGHTFSEYLERSGRLRERDTWVQWLKESVGQRGFTAAASEYERVHAWARFTQGDLDGAVIQLKANIERLQHAKEFDPAFELATNISMLGRVLYNAGASDQAIPILREALNRWEALLEKVDGQSSENLLALSYQENAAIRLNGLSATMGDLANALRKAGRYEEALFMVEKALRIQERYGSHREVAACHGQYARILMEAGRYDEADGHFDLLLAGARNAGDKGLEGSALQNQGILARERGQPERASRLYRQALERFWEAGNEGAIMRTYSLLGVVEQNAGHLDEARAWHEKSRELAVRLKDLSSLGEAAGNIGFICRKQGEAIRERGDEAAAREHFEEAQRSAEESLKVDQKLGNKPGEASSRGQLAFIHLRLGDLDIAERYAHEARQIHEALGLNDVWKDYHALSEIAGACGDRSAAAEWAQKRDKLLAKLKSSSEEGSELPAPVINALQALTFTCARVGFGNGSLGSSEEEILAKLDQAPSPLSDFADFLRQLAAGELPPIPDGLPGELRKWVEGLVQEIQDASQ